MFQRIKDWWGEKRRLRAECEHLNARAEECHNASTRQVRMIFEQDEKIAFLTSEAVKARVYAASLVPEDLIAELKHMVVDGRPIFYMHAPSIDVDKLGEMASHTIEKREMETLEFRMLLTLDPRLPLPAAALATQFFDRLYTDESRNNLTRTIAEKLGQ